MSEQQANLIRWGKYYKCYKECRRGGESRWRCFIRCVVSSGLMSEQEATSLQSVVDEDERE